MLRRALALAATALILSTTAVYADNVQNDVVAGGNDTITAGASTTVNYRIASNNGDGQTGCNAADSSPAAVTIIAPADVTAAPGSLSFTSCGTDQPVQFTSSTVGDYEITVTTSDSGAGSYNVNPAKFTLHVLPASAPDADDDGVPDSTDNCPNDANADQADLDADQVGDACDDNSYAPALGDPASDAGGDEGDTLGTSGSFTDEDGNASLTITKVSGDGSVTDNGNGTWSWSLATTDNGSGSVSVQADDGQHPTVTDSFTWSAGNVAPTATFNYPATVNEGSAIALSLTNPSDPSSVDTTAGFQYAFDCGTGFDVFGNSSSASCSNSDDGVRAVGGKIKDKDDGTTPYTGSVTIQNVAPSISSASFGSSSVACGTSNASLTVAFSDPGTADTWTVHIDWDNDGTFEESAAASLPSVTRPHTYGNAGVHTAAVYVTDDDGGTSATSTASVTVNYNLSSILQPINDTRNGQTTSLFKYGSTIPVKVDITDCDGSHPAGLNVRVTWRQGLGATPVGVDEVVPTSQADLGNAMRFSDPLYVLQLNSKNTTADSTSGITIYVTIVATGQSTWSNIGFKK